MGEKHKAAQLHASHEVALYFVVFKNNPGLMMAVDEWMIYYNENRIQTRLGSISPSTFEHRSEIKYSFYLRLDSQRTSETIK